MKRLLIILFCAVPLFGQSNTGELRLKVTDPSGLGVKTTVQVVSEANQYQNALTTDDQGNLDVQQLPFGVYQLEIHEAGFADVSQSVEIHSSIPAELSIKLQIAQAAQKVTVTAANTLINPDQAGAVSQIGSATIQNQAASLPGRSLQDLVNSQPGWLYEGNAVLHPRGSEYQTQFVIDGIPLTDNRSPSFGPDIGSDDVQSMSVYTAGIPAEYGRKMGGVVEINTVEDSQAGFHGEVEASGGSYGTWGGSTQGQYVWGANTFGAGASGDTTGHYLNPVVPQNFTNNGTAGDFSVHYQRDLTPKDRLSLSVRHEFSRYEIPNELVQEAPHQTVLDPLLPPGSQLQTGDNVETMGIISYQHTFSSDMVADVRGMVRENANDFNSNPYSTPIELFQHNWFREGYFKGTMTIVHGRHEIKLGVESDNMFLNENFRYSITDSNCFPSVGDPPTVNPINPNCSFDPGTLVNFSFPLASMPSAGNRPDLEQSAFVQDLIRLGKWTISAGLRWDHYQLFLNRQAVDPRFSISRYFPSADLVLHFSYDRIFQTPSFENILLSSSSAAAGLDTGSQQIPVPPSEGNYYEAGLTKAFFKKVKLDANYFRRLTNNFADDNQIQNTTIGFPIAFHNAIIYGAEAKLDVPEWRRFSGFLSYSYQVGAVWFPVTGGLFLGNDAMGLPTSGHFPNTQDQRSTVRGRVRYQLAPRVWIAGGIQYDTGLPFDFQGTQADALLTYGQRVVDRINFNTGRIDPQFMVNASVGADVYKSNRMNVRFQADGENLTNLLDVIDFGGLFSGNAIGPARSFALRLTTNF
jgi:hypothetical protein